jgi:tRNA(adenine34) deaminase
MTLTTSIWNSVLSQARIAAEAGEVPVGGVVVHGGQIIAEAHNQVEHLRDATAHTEMLLLRQAAGYLGTKALKECDLYVSLEPCAMCAGALSHARIRRLYFGAYDVKAGAVEHGIQFFSHPSCHHRPEIYGGFYQRECGELLKEFFKARRL